MPIPLSTSSTFEQPIKSNQTKVSTSNGPFNNPFRKKNLPNPSNDSSTNDELSKWKPSISKSRLATANKTTTTQNDVQSQMSLENEDNSLNGKRKIAESENADEEFVQNKRNRLQQFAV